MVEEFDDIYQVFDNAMDEEQAKLSFETEVAPVINKLAAKHFSGVHQLEAEGYWHLEEMITRYGNVLAEEITNLIFQHRNK